MENIEDSYVKVTRRSRRKLKKKISKLENSSSSECNDSSVPSSPVNANINDASSEHRDYFLSQRSWETIGSDFQIELQKQIKQRWKNDIEYADKIRKKKFPNSNKVYQTKPELSTFSPPPGLPHPAQAPHSNQMNYVHHSQRLHGLHGLHGLQHLHGHGGSHGLPIAYNERQFSQSLPELSKVHNNNVVPVIHEYNPIPSPPLFVEKDYYDHHPFVPTNDIIKQQSYYN